MNFGRRFIPLAERIFSYCHIEDASGGDTGGGGDTAVADSPQDNSGGLPDSLPGDNDSAAGDGDAGGDSGSGGDDSGSQAHVLDGAPGERGTQEYMDWFNELEYEDRLKVEEELIQGIEPKKPASEPANEGGDTPAGSEGASDKGKPDPNDVGEWTPEEFSNLDEPSQNRIKAMQEIITQFEPYMDGSLDKGLEILQNDPFIKARMEAIAADGVNSLPEEITKEFNIHDFLSEADNKHFELLNDEGKQTLSNSLLKAFEAGAHQGLLKEQYNTQAQVLVQKRVGEFTGQLNSIIDENPSLKPKQNADGTTPAFSDAEHPMHDYVVWAAKELGDDWLASKGHKAGYAAYLAVSGKSDEVLANVAKNVRTNFLKSLANADKNIAANAGSHSQSPTPATKTMDGIDLDRYKSDPTYRRQSFDGANQDLRNRLERFASTGEIIRAKQ